MTRRSPTNRRYQKDTKPAGSTKKSAASAKPKRDIDGSTNTSVKSTAKRAHYSVPDTPEYKQARKRWWIVLGAAVVLLVISLSLTFTRAAEILSLDEGAVRLAVTGLNLVSFAFIAASWWIDLKQIRPIVKAHQAKLAGKTFGTKKGVKMIEENDTQKDADA